MLAGTTLASRVRTTACGLGREHLASCPRFFHSTKPDGGRPIVGPIPRTSKRLVAGHCVPRPQAVVLASEARVVPGRNAPDVLGAMRATA